MDTMLTSLNYTTVYLDDILIKSKNTEQHRKDVWEVLKKIHEYSFKLGPEKCEFFNGKIEISGTDNWSKG